jgi:hypothetical protein
VPSQFGSRLSATWSESVGATAREVERMLVYVAVAFAVASSCGGATARVWPWERRSVSRSSRGTGSSSGCSRSVRPDDRPLQRHPARGAARYWNAFGLLTVLGTILAVAFVATRPETVSGGRRRGVGARSSSSLSNLSFSRGSWVALFFGLARPSRSIRRRLTILWSLLALAPASVLGVWVASRQDALTTDKVPGRRGRARWPPARGSPRGARHRVGSRWVAGAPRRRAGCRCRRGSAVAARSLSPVRRSEQSSSPLPLSAAVSRVRSRPESAFEAAPVIGASLNDAAVQHLRHGARGHDPSGLGGGEDHPIAGTGAGTYEITWYAHRPEGGRRA